MRLHRWIHLVAASQGLLTLHEAALVPGEDVPTATRIAAAAATVTSAASAVVAYRRWGTCRTVGIAARHRWAWKAAFAVLRRRASRFCCTWLRPGCWQLEHRLRGRSTAGLGSSRRPYRCQAQFGTFGAGGHGHSLVLEHRRAFAKRRAFGFDGATGQRRNSAISW